MKSAQSHEHTGHRRVRPGAQWKSPKHATGARGPIDEFPIWEHPKASKVLFSLIAYNKYEKLFTNWYYELLHVV